MRIAFGIVNLFPGGGLQRDCVEIAKLVGSRGHDVTIFAERVSGDFQSNGLSVVTLPNGAHTNHRRQRTFALDFLREASAKCDLIVGFDKLIGLDVLYCADPSMQGRLRREPYLKLLPRYRTYAGIESQSFGSGHKTRTMLLSQGQLLDYWDAWRTESQRMYLLPPTLSAARRRPEYRRNGVRKMMRDTLDLGDETWVWLTTGVQPKTKGTDRVIEALARFPDAQLLVAGMHETDKAAQPLAARTRSLGVADRVTWLGHREDMAEIMAASDLLLHPSRYDTTGTVILEAVVNGLPAIATAACGYASHISAAQAGMVIPEPFNQQLFEAAIRAARTPAAGEAWSMAGHTYGQRSGLSEGRWCAAQIILAAAQDKHPELTDASGVGLVPSDDEVQFDISTLQPAQDSDWAEYFRAAAPPTAPR